jgi:hypothetical protein
LNHFTVPVSSTDGPFEVVAWGLDRRDPTGIAVLLSMLSTSVTCAPFVAGANPNLQSFSWLHGGGADWKFR